MAASRLDKGSAIICWGFWALLVAVSVALLRPEPIQVRDELVPEDARFHAAKIFHIAGYAIMASIGFAAYPRRVPWVVAGLMVHGALMEVIQPHVGRHGTIMDAGFNTLGVALGLFTRWSLPKSPPAP